MLQGLARGLRVSSGKAAAAGCWSLIEQQILFANVSRLQLVRSLSSSRKDDVFQMKEADDGNNDGDKHPRAKTLDFKQKIYLKDQFGRMLGLKTRQEADLVASKNKLILVEDDTTKKIPTLRLMNPRKVNTDADVLPESTGQESDVEDHPEKRLNKKIPSKQLMFGAKLTDHDLITKIRQVKRWASKNFETVIRVHSQAADFSRMVSSTFVVVDNFESNSDYHFRSISVPNSNHNSMQKRVAKSIRSA